MFLRASGFFTFFCFFCFSEIDLGQIEVLLRWTKTCASNQRESPPLKVFRVKGFLAPGPVGPLPLEVTWGWNHCLTSRWKWVKCVHARCYLIYLFARWMQWWRFFSNEQRPPQFMQSLWSLALGLQNKHTHTHISLLWGSFWISWPNSHEWDRMGSFNRLIPVRCTLGTGKLVFIPHKRLNTFKRIWLWGPHTKKVKSNLWRFWHPKIAKKMQTQNPTRQHFGV